MDWISGYFHQVLNDVAQICGDKKIQVRLTLHIHVIYWYHLYIKHPVEIRLANIIPKACYWKGFVH